MNKLIIYQDGKAYELAASAVDEYVDIYGSSLDEVCLFYEQSIRRTKSPICKAIERSRYAEFMIHQLMSFECGITRKRAEQIILLCESAVATLTDTEKCDRSLYADIIGRCERNRRMATELIDLKII